MTDKRITVRKEAALIVCLFMLMSVFSGCGKNSLSPDAATAVQPEQKPIFLSIYAGEDFNPFTAKNMQNKSVLSLCYPGLFAIDAAYMPTSLLAEGYTAEGCDVVVKIKDNAVFSDGTPITAEDCVYSYKAAKASDSSFSSRLSAVTDFSARSENEFVVSFRSDCVQNVNMLDIPIVKKAAENSLFLIGAGAYFPEIAPTSKGTEGLVLYPNSLCAFENMSSAEKVEVVEFSSAEELLYSFNYGSVHAVFADLSEGKFNYRGNIELSAFTENNLVFAYANPASLFFTNYSIASKGISHAIDRRNLVGTVLDGCADPVWFPFNPSWEKTVAADLNSDIFSAELAKSTFYEARLYMNEGVLEWFAQPAAIRIVVNGGSATKSEAAELVAENLNSFGFIATVESLKWEDYKKAVDEKNYDILIAEIKLPPNMDISSVASAVGFSYSEGMQTAISGFNSGTLSMRDFLTVFSEEMPFIPLYYTRAALAVNRSIEGDFAPGGDYLFFNAGSWNVVSNKESEG